MGEYMPRLLLCFLSLVPALLGAQTSPPRDGLVGELASGTAVVRGRVTDAETGATLPRISVSLTRVGTRAQVDTMSDTMGAFEFTRVPAGEYTLTADPIGRTTHGWSAYNQPGEQAGAKRSTLVLQDGQLFDQAHIALPRRYVITARVIDEYGEPLPDMLVRVEGLEGATAGGRARTTDDRGTVRLWGYAPGTYRVCAVPADASDSAAGEGFIRTCYPSATWDSDALPVTVANADPPELEIRLHRSRLFRISGVVVDASGHVAPNARVSFVRVEDNSYASRSLQAEQGSFSIRGVAPGQYFIRADVGDMFDPGDPTRQSGYAPVKVQSADIEHLEVVMSPLVTIRGRLRFDGPPPRTLSTAMVRAEPARNSIAVMRGRIDSAARVRPDLTFELKGLFGPYTVQVDGLRGWIAKSVRYRGEERLDVPTEFRTGSGTVHLEIVLTNQPGELTARAFDINGRPVEEAQVVLFPADSRHWDLMTAVRRSVRRHDAQVFENLRPAEYLVAVVPPGMSSVNTRRSLEELSKGAERITIVEGDRRTIDLVVRR